MSRAESAAAADASGGSNHRDAELHQSRGSANNERRCVLAARCAAYKGRSVKGLGADVTADQLRLATSRSAAPTSAPSAEFHVPYMVRSDAGRRVGSVSQSRQKAVPVQMRGDVKDQSVPPEGRPSTDARGRVGSVSPARRLSQYRCKGTCRISQSRQKAVPVQTQGDV